MNTENEMHVQQTVYLFYFCSYLVNNHNLKMRFITLHYQKSQIQAVVVK